MLPENFFDNQCQEYIQVDPNGILAGALDKLQSRKGNLDWTLVVRRMDGFVAAHFSEILRWERRQPDRQAVRLSSINNPDLPLQPATTAEDTSTLEELIASTRQSPSGFVVILWAGTEMVCGTASLDQLETLQEGIGPPNPARPEHLHQNHPQKKELTSNQRSRYPPNRQEKWPPKMSRPKGGLPVLESGFRSAIA
jgi:hypothetical protein